MPRGRPSKYDSSYCDRIKELAAQGMSKTECAVELGIAWSTFHDWQQKHQDFSDAVKESERLCMAWWEKNGREATFGAISGFNATSYIFQMKNRFPNDWSDKSQVESRNTDKNGNDVPPTQALTAKEIAEAVAAIRNEYK